MELIEEQLEKLGFTPSETNGIRSWEKVKNLDNWIETEWDLLQSPKANSLRKGIIKLVWRLDGHTQQSLYINYQGDQDRVIPKILELNRIMFQQEIRDSKLEELGI